MYRLSLAAIRRASSLVRSLVERRPGFNLIVTSDRRV